MSQYVTNSWTFCDLIAENHIGIRVSKSYLKDFDLTYEYCNIQWLKNEYIMSTQRSDCKGNNGTVVCNLNHGCLDFSKTYFELPHNIFNADSRKTF